MEGVLSKWTNVVNGWQYRWFVLDECTGLFSYYTSKEKRLKGIRRGCVRLHDAVIGIDDEDDTTFIITVDGKTFHFQAQDEGERERWIRALEDVVLAHNPARRNISKPGLKPAIAARSYDFDRKLAEAESYLQILITQVSALKQKTRDPGLTEESRDLYEKIVDKASSLIESIQHAVTLLQIAKDAAMPMADEITPSKSSAESPATVTVISAKSISPSLVKASFLLVNDPIELGIEVGSECTETKSDDPPVKNVARIRKSPMKAAEIPEISYSSSEDEDFYDAEDDDDNDAINVISSDVIIPNGVNDHYEVKVANDVIVSGNNEDAETSSDMSTTPVNDTLPLCDASALGVDYDALYDANAAKDDDVDMKSHGSVITHLLSQVRIGMDLTKIVLPTFILERRSLLEMYSDFFAHPDLFLDITEGKNPEERMIRVLRWYLSSFHAGRTSAIAKKPYNPILGETFRCHWDVDETDSSPDTKYPSPPTPWTRSEGITPEHLTFVAEQVSHHPPISAFYAEHVKKRISLNGHIYTKSSFLGTSVAVHNVGEGTVSLLDLKENYTFTFPSGYGRSILTVPWIELGGKVSIKCPETGYVSNVEFKCKPFFGSEVNKVVAEVFSPGSKKSLLRVEGEWNGKMMAKWASGTTEVFMDVSKLRNHTKICRKVAQQDPNESRRLWKDVTYGLKVGDIDAATSAKARLEQRQRDEASRRKELNVAWETKLFKPVGENWAFNEPLVSRISNI